MFHIGSAPGLWGEIDSPLPEVSAAFQDMWYCGPLSLSLLIIGTQSQLLLSANHKCFWLV